MKKLKSKEDFAVKTKNIFNALTQHVPDSKHEQARRFFLKSVSTRIAILLIMSNFFEDKKTTASDIYNTLHPKYGSKSSFVNFISLGVKKGYFKMKKCTKDSRKKYLYPSVEFTQIWCQFISRSEGAPIDKNINWNDITKNCPK